MSRNDPLKRLAAPFLSASQEVTAAGRRGSILLVGKATDKDWKMDSFVACAREKQLEERRRASRGFLAEMSQKPKSEFWRFLQHLGEIGLPVIWTNLVKIGVISGNPRGWYLEAQHELAVNTLRAEIAEYKPALVVLVTSDFAKDQIIYRIWPKKTWRISGYDGTCWIKKDGNKPPVLWTDHPQGKAPERSAYWLKKANWLLRS
jgi:hypothetical protein